MKTKRSGFSLVEMLIAISIFSILVGIIVLNMRDATASGRDSKRVSDFNMIADTLENYYNKKGFYPIIDGTTATVALSNAGSWTTFENTLKNAGFNLTLPRDPQNGGIYTYCIDNATSPTKYSLMANLEIKNQALSDDYDKDWPATDYCNCNNIAGNSISTDAESAAPYTYCVRNP